MKLTKSKAIRHYYWQGWCQTMVSACCEYFYCEDRIKVTDKLDKVSCKACLRMVAGVAAVDDDPDFQKFLDEERTKQEKIIREGGKSEYKLFLPNQLKDLKKIAFLTEGILKNV